MRKFVQLLNIDHRLLGLANDGTVWMYRGGLSNYDWNTDSETVVEPAGWVKYPDLPQEETNA